MRHLLSIPFAVLVLSATIWLLCMNEGAAGTRQWLIRICELLFAAAAFALMFSLARTTIG